MARLINGINGPFTGKVGAVIGSTWNGIPYMKSRHRRRTKKVSTKEMQSRNKFSMTHFWLQPLLPFVREGFKNYSQRSMGFNAAKSHLLKNAFETVDSNLVINPALVKLSSGDLPLPGNITAEKSAPGKITFTWDNGYTGASQYDQVMLAAHNNKDGHAYCKITGQFRSTGTDTLNVPVNKTYHLYLAFTAADRSRQSDSVYLGEMNV